MRIGLEKFDYKWQIEWSEMKSFESHHKYLEIHLIRTSPIPKTRKKKEWRKRINWEETEPVMNEETDSVLKKEKVVIADKS